MRDAILKRQQTLSGKVDKPDHAKAVMVAVDGSVWFDQARRLVWVQRVGDTAVPMPAYNRNVKAQAGIPVLLEIMEGAQFPVVRDLDVEVMANPAGVAAGWLQSAFLTDHHADHEPGGNDQMWLYPEAFTPLAVVPGTSGLTITVISGYYELNGVRTFFAGAVDQDISASQPSSGEHRFVGVYIDDANSLGTVDGTAVPDGTGAVDPTWPAGAIPLAVVDLDGDQTDIQLGRDIFNRRSFVTSGGGGSFTDFSQVVYVSKDGSDSNSGLNPEKSNLTIGAAITAAASIITGGAANCRIEVLDGGTYDEDLTVSTGLHVYAPAARLIGEISLAAETSFVINEHYAENGGAAMVSRSGSSGHAIYKANMMDTRGLAGTLTTVLAVANGSSGGVLHVHVDRMYVGEDCGGISDSAGGFGHVHFYCGDIYLVGDNAAGIGTLFAGTNLIGYVDHILENGSFTGTVGIALASADTIVKITVGEIIADKVWNISAGDLHIVCPKLTGTKTGTATFEASEFTVGHPFSVRTVDKNKKSAWHSTISAAITAASAGDVILIGPGTYSEALTVSKAVTLKGEGNRADVIITTSAATTAAITANAKLENLTINHTGSGGSYYAVQVSGSGVTATIQNCAINTSDAAGYAVRLVSNGVGNFIECAISGTGGGLIIPNLSGANGLISGGTLASSGGFALSVGASVSGFALRGPMVTNGTINGVWVGRYVNSSGVLYFPSGPVWYPGNDGAGSGLDADLLDGVQGVSYLQRTSANRPGVTKLYRRDEDSNFNVQTHWTGTNWLLRGYNGDTYHAPCQVYYCDVAGYTLTLGAYTTNELRNGGCSVLRTSNQAISAGVFTPVTFSQYYQNSSFNSFWDGGTALYAQATGWFTFWACAQIAPTGNTDNCLLAIAVNGTIILVNQQRRSSSTLAVNLNVAGSYYMSSGNYIQLLAFAGANANVIYASPYSPVMGIMYTGP